MAGSWFILDDDGAPVAVDDPLVWAVWMNEHRTDDGVGHRVAADDVDGCFISTVFFGIDLSLDLAPRTGPALWETAVFRPGRDICIVGRYGTLNDARRGHAATVELARAGVLSREIVGD